MTDWHYFDCVPVEDYGLTQYIVLPGNQDVIDAMKWVIEQGYYSDLIGGRPLVRTKTGEVYAIENIIFAGALAAVWQFTCPKAAMHFRLTWG